MYIFNHDFTKPSIDALLQCHKVSVAITDTKPKTMRDWARTYCESFVWWELYEHGFDDDIVVDYYFINGEDATMFRLKWC